MLNHTKHSHKMKIKFSMWQISRIQDHVETIPKQCLTLLFHLSTHFQIIPTAENTTHIWTTWIQSRVHDHRHFAGVNLFETEQVVNILYTFAVCLETGSLILPVIWIILVTWNVKVLKRSSLTEASFCLFILIAL